MRGGGLSGLWSCQSQGGWDFFVILQCSLPLLLRVVQLVFCFPLVSLRSFCPSFLAAECIVLCVGRVQHISVVQGQCSVPRTLSVGRGCCCQTINQLSLRHHGWHSTKLSIPSSLGQPPPKGCLPPRRGHTILVYPSSF